MKKLKTLSAVGFVVLLTACGGTQTSTTNSTKTQEANRGRTNTEVASGRNPTSTSTSRSTLSGRVTTTTTTINAQAADEERMQKMYSDLGMDQGQRARFEREWKNTSESWKRTDRNKTMNSFERTEYQDRILKDILTEQQFQQYQEWARENAATMD